MDNYDNNYNSTTVTIPESKEANSNNGIKGNKDNNSNNNTCNLSNNNNDSISKNSNNNGNNNKNGNKILFFSQPLFEKKLRQTAFRDNMLAELYFRKTEKIYRLLSKQKNLGSIGKKQETSLIFIP